MTLVLSFLLTWVPPTWAATIEDLYAAALPNDPGYAHQWYHETIGMPVAWDFAKGSPSVTIAVLDTGIDLAHQDLRDRLWTNPGEVAGDGIDNDGNGYIDDVHGWDFVGNDADPDAVPTPQDSLELVHHGTLVAGLIGAAGYNGVGIAGVNWNARLMPLRVLDASGGGSSASVEAAVRYATRMGARVINVSFSGSTYSASLASALRAAHRAGVVVVAAAGNDGDTQRGGNLDTYPAYPVCYRGQVGEPLVIGVASLDRNGAKSSFTNYGASCVALSAPGEHVYTTQVVRQDDARLTAAYGGGWAGSSLAAPLVAGTAALMLSVDPSLTPVEVRSILTATAASVEAQNGAAAAQLGAGRLDAGRAVAAVQARVLARGVSPAPGPSAPTVPSQPAAAASDAWSVVSVAGLFPRIAVFRAPDAMHATFPVSSKRYAPAPPAAIVRAKGQQTPLIAVGASKGEAPVVRIFTAEGALVRQFDAYALSFKGGVVVAAADVNGDGGDEIVVGPGAGGGPHVRVFDADGRLLHQWFAFPSEDRFGLRLAGFDLDADGKDEIAVASAGRRTELAVFTPEGKRLETYAPFDRAFPSGLQLAAGDITGDGIDELIVAPAADAVAQLVMLDRSGRWIRDIMPYGRSTRTRLTFAAGAFKGRAALLVTAPASPGEIRAYAIDGTSLGRARLSELERSSLKFSD